MGEKITATYDRDSKRFHRYLIDDGQALKGVLYVPKNSKIPEEVAITLRVKEPVQPTAYLNPGA
ncbi:MAG: hypothetical protein GTN76_04910 [Candidatus Aenigmarchaeota archaeon]|nr:hypothetical protein [Candidatus Aenigmarchaeota archaeon]